MSQIKILPIAVINKIAAGEVIDRPAAVVKEVIENAIDAGASRIDTHLEDGGRKSIRISDDGIGMDAEDLALAFQSHATSKLRNADDLFAIHTLGFRGEALPSIGAVSHASIISRVKGSLHGAEVTIDGGILGKIKECGAPEGTQVEVRDLFFNVPVRKKFLRTIPTEMAYISEVLTRFALSYPAIHFTLMHNNRTVFNLPPVRDTAERIAICFGEEMKKQLIPVFLREEQFVLSGFIAPPFFDKANARMQFIFLNGRYIKDGAIFRAISESYRGKLMYKRYPVVFLFLQVEPSGVDVNVHPTKTEVRFRNTNAVYNYVLSALKEGLNKSTAKTIDVSSSVPGLEKELVAAEDVDLVKKSLWEQFSLRKTDANLPGPDLQKRIEIPLDSPYKKGELMRKEGKGSVEGFPNEEKSGECNTIQTGIKTKGKEKVFPAEGIGKKKVCFQIHDAFIVEETDDGLNIIDQHALHEIILYHEIERGMRTSQSPSQRLLIPELVELSPKDFFNIISLKENLRGLGVDVEEFGLRTIAIRSFPQVLRRLHGKEFIESLLAGLSDDDYLKGKDSILDKLISIMACKGAIKAGQRLEPSEIEELLKMKKRINAYTNNCPHGRPTALHFSLDELQKQFKRK
ncbi:MAG: DNA mismatch repair protein [Candidatus Brocadia sinica]|uniref:DNA mismatch repair protein MutL n=1 Tax=Candidatus Brocadia sinica JPN1 TaxID=1197129 RepID=A0ABQ0JW29_9BACT|nr:MULTISPECIES: DNA mismatch repair endonuclease MutL [Brocadia]KXK29717.1 MAG: DNA mismatch repair protein [Candidatus Brocadia sinica]NOG41192.1 DNA mismatch repair endonuclease MutL [Planctomycetota bacterium]MCK6466794.1 DNA mismatch repair endonuclease MutL [Candidatus Brocadia sinica]NUO04500.1 DNA mismatch repair endonuclease MutL [Candidatus Brocadia sinica]GAN32979.1 DNA mismatch repair protein [Candidatus Brocadia sinica JPN1]